ncbi:DEXDc helicase [Spiroplasma gladiatoris]|uniref:DEXDc helicase n=1 Tax=Spiroplasma gladiatoris TaxID=2143 RepID=A0A4P7AHY7_9MOLU|nr:UvrD-helicase domain-containing protein [Spiroplasma gladiatoris]QBQ07857.1 DEXDc helicase [Spiroplasma gladiatoris]
MSFIPSDEQVSILKSLKEGKNLKIEAVAGSGKTTTCLYLAKNCLNKKFLLLTFNKDLSSDNNHKIEKLGLTNIKSYTFHSFFGHCYN